jgi:hypothetical protein
MHIIGYGLVCVISTILGFEYGKKQYYHKGYVDGSGDLNELKDLFEKYKGGKNV